jgi:hypothetical protein
LAYFSDHPVRMILYFKAKLRPSSVRYT